eukprot:4263164-Prymnesium_polylepis.1
MNQVLETVERIHPVPPPLSLPHLLCKFSAMAAEAFICKPCKRMGSNAAGRRTMAVRLPPLASAELSARVGRCGGCVAADAVDTDDDDDGPGWAVGGKFWATKRSRAPSNARTVPCFLATLAADDVGPLLDPIPAIFGTPIRFDLWGCIAVAAGVREEVAKEALQEHRKQSETKEEESEPARLKRVEELLEELLVMGEAQVRRSALTRTLTRALNFNTWTLAL